MCSANLLTFFVLLTIKFSSIIFLTSTETKHKNCYAPTIITSLTEIISRYDAVLDRSEQINYLRNQTNYTLFL